MWGIGDVKRSARAALANYYWQALKVTAVWALVGVLVESFNSNLYKIGSHRTSTVGQLLSQNYYGAVVWNGAEYHIRAVVLAVIIALLHIFVTNPLRVGLQRYITKSQLLGGPAPSGELWWAFRCGFYGNVVKIMFLQDLYTVLWTLLFIIPGIVKSLEYTMIPFILAENPEVDTRDAFALTKDMTGGCKLQLLLLSLSFIGWYLLESLGIYIFIWLLGMLGLFFMLAASFLSAYLGSILLTPYVLASTAEVYLFVRREIRGFPFGGFGVDERMEETAAEE